MQNFFDWHWPDRPSWARPQPEPTPPPPPEPIDRLREERAYYSGLLQSVLRGYFTAFAAHDWSRFDLPVAARLDRWLAFHHEEDAA